MKTRSVCASACTWSTRPSKVATDIGGRLISVGTLAATGGALSSHPVAIAKNSSSPKQIPLFNFDLQCIFSPKQMDDVQRIPVVALWQLSGHSETNAS